MKYSTRRPNKDVPQVAPWHGVRAFSGQGHQRAGGVVPVLLLEQRVAVPHPAHPLRPAQRVHVQPRHAPSRWRSCAVSCEVCAVCAVLIFKILGGAPHKKNRC